MFAQFHILLVSFVLFLFSGLVVEWTTGVMEKIAAQQEPSCSVCCKLLCNNTSWYFLIFLGNDDEWNEIGDVVLNLNLEFVIWYIFYFLLYFFLICSYFWISKAPGSLLLFGNALCLQIKDIWVCMTVIEVHNFLQ
jgi:hypothetical protein